jgi:N utilization substance protein B
MMKPSRHQAREVALQILYRYDMALHSTEAQAQGGSAPLTTALPQAAWSAGTPSSVIAELNGHFDHFNVPLELRGFAAELVAGSLQEMPQLDALLEKHASNWKIGRMGFVDRNLLRMAIYELSHFPETPSSVVIDEAIELAKQFGTAESPAFINGVLDAVKNVVVEARVG